MDDNDARRRGRPPYWSRRGALSALAVFVAVSALDIWKRGVTGLIDSLQLGAGITLAVLLMRWWWAGRDRQSDEGGPRDGCAR